MMLVRQFLRDTLWVAIGYTVLLLAALTPAILFWPRFQKALPTIQEMIPFESIRRFVEHVEVDGYWPYFCVQQFFKGGSLFGLAAAALIGSGLIAREADQKTAEFLLSRPISRRRVLLTRWAVAVVLITAPIFITSLLGMWISTWVDESLALGEVLCASAFTSLFLVMLLSATVLLSTICDHQLKAGLIVIGVVLLQFALYLVETVNDWSLFSMIDVEVYMRIGGGGFPWWQAGVFAGASAIMVSGAVVLFERRDF
jgi:ABC-type transport system involved in multi-copper enzyme maturation permease subunit